MTLKKWVHDLLVLGNDPIFERVETPGAFFVDPFESCETCLASRGFPPSPTYVLSF